MQKKYAAAVIAAIIFTLSAKSQCTGMLDSVKNEMYRINKVFDSAAYLSFDMNVVYYTDTCALNCSKREGKTINYQLNAKNYYYSAGNVEFLQNDSFAISVDHDEKSMIVTPSSPNDVAGGFMLKDFVNYSLNVYDSIYQICITDIDSITRRISFTAASDISPYKYLILTYDMDTYNPLAISAELSEPLLLDGGQANSAVPPHIDTLKQFIVMKFQNYKPVFTGKVFDEANYFIKQYGKQRFLPVEKYKYYQFVTAGLDEEPLEDNPVSR